MDLTDALGLEGREVVAFVGGGGKTSSMYRLALEAAGRGRRAVATGTARFTEPAEGSHAPLILRTEGDALLAAVGEALARQPWVIAAAGRGSKGRLLPIDETTVAALANLTGVGLVAVEADGSALRPFKAPAGHEPAVPAAATLVVAVAGADVFGRPLESAYVHRPEQVAALTGVPLGEPVAPSVVAGVLAHEDGGRKGVPGSARYAVLINKVTPERLAAARETARLLVEAGVSLVVLADVKQARPVVEVIVAPVSGGLLDRPQGDDKIDKAVGRP